MSSIHRDLDEFEQRLGYTFRDREYLRRALTHKSFSHESKARNVADNETYEFLGDSVLGFLVGDVLFHRFPTSDEGALSKMKAFLVSSTSLARKAKQLGMGHALLLGVGEERSGGRNKDSLLANLFEAVVAAVYLDGGIAAARDLIARTFESDLIDLNESDLLFHDYKTALQEIVQSLGQPLPDYAVVDEIGPDHDKRFIVEVALPGGARARGEGSSKKEAQQQAAREALKLYPARARGA
ncbi:MAG: ribonuclease III [Thermoanaerobaculia bacterium]